MHRKHIDIILIRLDHPLQQPIPDSEDNRQLRPAVDLRRPNLGVVDLVHRPKMHHLGRIAVLLGRLEDNPRRRRPRHLGRFAQQRPKLVDDVELAEEIYLEVSVQPVGSLAVLVDIDARGEYEQIESTLSLPHPRKYLLDFVQIAHVAGDPFDFGVSASLLFDLVDGGLALFFLAVDHDDARAVEHERTGDFISNTQGSAGHEGDSAGEIVDLLSGTDDGLEDGLHSVEYTIDYKVGR